MDVTFDTSELNALVVDLGTSAVRVGAEVAGALRKTAYDIEATSKQFAPVDTGNLRNSISTTIEGDGRGGSMRAEIGPTAEYGHFVEYGTSRAAPAAFMGPALDRHEHQLVSALERIAAGLL